MGRYFLNRTGHGIGFDVHEAPYINGNNSRCLEKGMAFSVEPGICVLSAFCCFMIYAIGGQKIASLFSKTTVVKYIQRIIGGTFIGAGIGLAASNK